VFLPVGLGSRLETDFCAHRFLCFIFIYSFLIIVVGYVVSRVTTCLENLEMSGNLKPVMEMSGNLKPVMEMSGNLKPVMEMSGNLKPVRKFANSQGIVRKLSGNKPCHGKWYQKLVVAIVAYLPKQ